MSANTTDTRRSLVLVILVALFMLVSQARAQDNPPPAEPETPPAGDSAAPGSETPPGEATPPAAGEPAQPAEGEAPPAAEDPPASAEPPAPPPDPARIGVDDLLRLATSGDLPVRLHAISKLGRTRDPALATKLTPFLTDRNREIRAGACDALGNLGAKEGLGPLLSAVSDREPTVAAAAIRACERLDPPGAVGQLIGTAPMSTPALRRATAQALAALTGRQIGDLGSDDAGDVALSWDAWRKWWGTNQSRSPYAWALDGTEDARASGRMRAIHRLAALGDSAAMPACIRSLGDASGAVAGAALEACQRLSGIVLPKCGVETDAEKLATRTAWSTWWERNESRSRIDWLIAALKADAPITRSSAARSLAAFDPSTPADPVPAPSPLETPPSLDVRLPALIAALDDEAAPVRAVADAGLRDLTDRSSGFDAEGGPELRKEAVSRWRSWWESNKTRNRQKWLCDGFLNDDSLPNRVAAARALADDDEELSIVLLVGSLKDPKAPIRAAALSALHLRTGNTFDLDPDADPETQDRAHARWQVWLAERQAQGK